MTASPVNVKNMNSMLQLQGTMKVLEQNLDSKVRRQLVPCQQHPAPHPCNKKLMMALTPRCLEAVQGTCLMSIGAVAFILVLRNRVLQNQLGVTFIKGQSIHTLGRHIAGLLTYGLTLDGPAKCALSTVLCFWLSCRSQST